MLICDCSLSIGLGSLISEKEFHNAVYSFDMGQNDISIAFIANLSYPRVVDNIPSILSRIEDAIEASYSIELSFSRRMLFPLVVVSTCFNKIHFDL